MLIRSQSKERIVDFDRASVGIDHKASNDSCVCVSICYPENTRGPLGRYSSKEKAIKVLDMIQEAYAEVELTRLTISEIGKTFKEAPATEENELLAEAVGEVLRKKMVFQMPEDSEVEA